MRLGERREMKIVTAEQMREIEERSESAGVSAVELMDNAGLAVARRVRQHLGHLVGVPVLALIGPGNNGGDGLVASGYLQGWGARVTAYVCADRRTQDPTFDAASSQGVEVAYVSEDGGLEHLHDLLAASHAVMDAVLGTRRSRPLTGAIKDVLLAVSTESDRRDDLQVVAVDLPSGVDGDTGAADPACPGADVTVALGHPKRGLFHHPGADLAGDIEVVDIGIPDGLDGEVPLELMTADWAAGLLPERPSGSHKGTFGKTLMLVGSRNYVGAASLAATAAVRVGGGLVTLALPESLRSAVAAGAREPTYLPLPESSPGVVASDAASHVLEAAAGYDAVLVGCGLGLATPTVEMVEGVLLSGARLPPAVIDADGLNVLSRTDSGDSGWWTRLPSPSVLTPHAGEMARLTGTTVEDVQADRVATAIESASRWECVTVLKGAYTVVARPDGTAMISPFANPGLASAGTGDVLAGAIAGLISKGLTPADAAALGVYFHGAAGERVREELGEAGMVAGDLLSELPKVIATLRTGA